MVIVFVFFYGFFFFEKIKQSSADKAEVYNKQQQGIFLYNNNMKEIRDEIRS